MSLPIRLALVGLLFVYAVQLHSPLRLNTDAVVILRLTANLTDGKPYLINGARPLYPIGVPLIYSLMERAGIATALGFGLLNLICMSVAAYAAFILCANLGLRQNVRGGIVLISFSSFVLIKHSLVPLTDIPFLATSMLCCASLEIYPRKHSGEKIGVLSLAILLLAGSVLIRRVGVALIPALVYAVWVDARQNRFLKMPPVGSAGRRLILPGVAVMALFAGLVVLRHLLYVPDFHVGGSLSHAVLRQLSLRMNDFGELLINLPVSRAVRLRPLVLAGGVLLTVLIGVGLWRTRREWHSTHLYFLTYLVILAVWPFGDARFWIPVLPLIAIVVFQAIAPLDWFTPIGRTAMAYLVVYGILAMVSVLYTTRISYAGDRFSKMYGDPTAGLAYDRAFAGGQLEPTDEWGLIIRRYGLARRQK
jgi:hypothetical protein